METRICVCVCACVSPHNLGTISENLHVNVAGPVGMSHNIDLTEFSLRSWCLEKHMRTEYLNFFILFHISSSNGYQWLDETYLLHFDVIIPVYFLSSE